MSGRSRRLRPPFVPLLVSCDLRPIRHGEEKLSRGYSSIARAAAVPLIPTPWNWIFLPMAHIPLARNPKMAGCRLRPSAFMRL